MLNRNPVAPQFCLRRYCRLAVWLLFVVLAFRTSRGEAEYDSGPSDRPACASSCAIFENRDWFRDPQERREGDYFLAAATYRYSESDWTAFCLMSVDCRFGWTTAHSGQMVALSLNSRGDFAWTAHDDLNKSESAPRFKILRFGLQNRRGVVLREEAWDRVLVPPGGSPQPIAVPEGRVLYFDNENQSFNLVLNGGRLECSGVLDVWHAYSPADGSLLAETVMPAKPVTGVSNLAAYAACPVQGTGLTLVAWQAEFMFQGLRYSLINRDWNEVWSLDEPGGLFSGCFPPANRRDDTLYDRRTIDCLDAEGRFDVFGIPGRVNLDFVIERPVQKFVVTRDESSGWRVEEIGVTP